MVVDEKAFREWMEKKYKRDFTLKSNEYDWLQAYDRIIKLAYNDTIIDLIDDDYGVESIVCDLMENEYEEYLKDIKE